LIQEVGTNVERKLTTDENGNYEAPALQPGHYVIKVETKGFALSRRKTYCSTQA
jgi:uncharacterized surface anchored protein